MAMITSAFAYLGSYYSEANPSLQGKRRGQASTHTLADSVSGQTLFTRGDPASLALMDKQIYRLIGKATTLAAYVTVPLSTWICG
jgi:citrate synthase